jgi:hypothetical protein
VSFEKHFGRFFLKKNVSGHTAAKEDREAEHDPRLLFQACFATKSLSSNFFGHKTFCLKTVLYSSASEQGDQIGRIFAEWVIVYFRQ